MSSTTSKLLGEALHLTVKERAELAAAILASLDGEPEDDVEQAWAVEIERRARKSLAGEGAPEDWNDVHERLKK